MAGATTFKYEIVDAGGKLRKGTIDSVNQDAAAAALKAQGNFVVSLKPANVMERDLEIHIGRAVKPRELSIFCRQFQSILNAGVTVIEALGMLGEQTENKAFQKAILNVRDAVQKGETLSNAMAAYPKIFPNIMLHMVAAGEASGSLDVAFDRIGRQFEKDAHLAGLVGKSMIYPIVLIVVIIAVVAIMMIKIVPTFTATFSQVGAELPAITRAVMGVSDFLVGSWYYFLGGIAVFILLLREVKKTEWGALFFGRLSLRLPLFGSLTIKSASANLARTLSTLMAAGISLMESVKLVQRIVKNAVVQQALKQAEKDVTEGRTLSASLEDTDVFPPMVYHMIRIGEETGNLESMLDKISDYYEEEVEMATQSLMAALEPLLIVMMALIVVPILLAIMTPMFSLYNSL